MEASKTNNPSMKLQVPAQLLEAVDPILEIQGLDVDKALCMFIRIVAQINFIPSVVTNVGNNALVGGTRKEIQLHLPVDIQSKAQAVFIALGLSQSTAAAMFLKAVIDAKTLPFSVK